MANINDQKVGHVYVDQLSKYENLANKSDSSIFFVKDTGIFIGTEQIANYVNLVDLLTKADASVIYQQKLTFDDEPTVNSSNPVTSGGVFSALSDKQDTLTAGEGINITNNNTVQTTGIPYGVCDTTCTSTAFTATVPGIYKLENGVCCMLKNGVVSSGKPSFTLDVNGLGPKTVYTNMASETVETTIFNANYTMLFIYDSSRGDNGGWICYRGYDSGNTNTIGYQLRTNSTVMTVTDTARYYKIYFTSADGKHWVPASANSTNSSTSAKPVNQRPIDPFGRIVYTSATTSYKAGANLAATTIWDQYVVTLGYSFNVTNEALTLTAKEPVYIKCTPQSNGSAIIDSSTPYVQTLPSVNDNKIYIFLGVATEATKIELYINHPVYYHDGTGIRVWIGKSLADYYDKTEVNNLITDISSDITWISL